MKRCVVVLILALAACSNPGGRLLPVPQPAPAPPPTVVPAPLSARLELASSSMRAGSSLKGRVIVQNNTGQDLHVTGCGSVFVVALSSDEIQPEVLWPTCAQPITIPVGESTYPATVQASYSSCTNTSQPGPNPRCINGTPPPLPPVDYRATLFQNPQVVPPPPPTTVRVTAS